MSKSLRRSLRSGACTERSRTVGSVGKVFLRVTSCPSWLMRKLRTLATFPLTILVLLSALCQTAAAQGRTDCASLTSRILHRPVRYCVMLPPSYEMDTNKKYPALYFLHGLGENEQTMLRSGGWGLIEDLRQQHKIGDFIMIAPDGRGSFFINSADGSDRYNDFFRTEFIPYIESHYRIIRDRKARGVTGLSMGGYGALRFAFAQPEFFSSVSAQSPALITESPKEMNADLRDAGPLAKLLGGVFGNPINVPHWNANNPFNLARQNRTQIKTEAIYINCGAQDEYGFAEGASKLHQRLLAEGLRHEFHLYPGGHSAEYFLSHLGETIEFHSRVFEAAGK
jgi:S-formylglutathione hydrolase FrmB